MISGVSHKNYILHVKIKRGKIKTKAKKIWIPKKGKAFEATGVAHFKIKKETYFVLRHGRRQRIVQIYKDKKKKYKMKYISEVHLPIIEKSKYISSQGTTCEIDSRGYYYVGLSYAGEKDILKKSNNKERERAKKMFNRKWKNTSYIDVYKFDTSLGIKEPRGYYMGRLTLKAKDSQISWKSKAKRKKAKSLKHCVKFEIEDMYIYKKQEGCISILKAEEIAKICWEA